MRHFLILVLTRWICLEMRYPSFHCFIIRSIQNMMIFWSIRDTFPSINQGKFWAGWINFFNMVHGWAENGRANSSHLQVASLISKHRAFRRGKASWRSFPTDGCTGAGQSPVAASGCWSSRCCMRIRCLEVLEVLEVVKRLVGENGWTWHSGSEIGCIG